MTAMSESKPVPENDNNINSFLLQYHNLLWENDFLLGLVVEIDNITYNALITDTIFQIQILTKYLLCIVCSR